MRIFLDQMASLEHASLEESANHSVGCWWWRAVVFAYLVLRIFFVQIVIVSVNHILTVVLVAIVIVIVATDQPTDMLLMDYGAVLDS